MTDSERLKEVEKYTGKSTRALASSLELKQPQTLYDIHKGKHGISKALANIIHAKYLNINPFWLLTGEGKMFVNKTQTEELADRISEIITDLQYEKLTNINESFGLKENELGRFTNMFVFPSVPFDFVKFLREYPEYNLKWILTGEGSKFNGNEEECLQKIKDRIYHKNHPEYFLNEQKETQETPSHTQDAAKFWEQIAFQNEQLQEKDEQINKLINLLEKLG